MYYEVAAQYAVGLWLTLTAGAKGVNYVKFPILFHVYYLRMPWYAMDSVMGGYQWCGSWMAVGWEDCRCLSG